MTVNIWEEVHKRNYSFLMKNSFLTSYKFDFHISVRKETIIKKNYDYYYFS